MFSLTFVVPVCMFVKFDNGDVDGNVMMTWTYVEFLIRKVGGLINFLYRHYLNRLYILLRVLSPRVCLSLTDLECL